MGLWSACHVIPKYPLTPERKGEFEKYPEDEQAIDSLTPTEYERRYQPAPRKYDAGHLAPYKISGGDRDGDDLYACYRPRDVDDVTADEPRHYGDCTAGEWASASATGSGYCGSSDPDDENTVFEINYLSNLAPQYATFNEYGSWRTLERQIQDTWVGKDGMELWVIGGSVFTSEEPDK